MWSNNISPRLSTFPSTYKRSRCYNCGWDIRLKRYVLIVVGALTLTYLAIYFNGTNGIILSQLSHHQLKHFAYKMEEVACAILPSRSNCLIYLKCICRYQRREMKLKLTFPKEIMIK